MNSCLHSKPESLDVHLYHMVPKAHCLTSADSRALLSADSAYISATAHLQDYMKSLSKVPSTVPSNTSAWGSYSGLWVSWCADWVKSDLRQAVPDSANPALRCCSLALFRGRARSSMISYCQVHDQLPTDWRLFPMLRAFADEVLVQPVYVKNKRGQSYINNNNNNKELQRNCKTF